MSENNVRSYVKYTFFKADKAWRRLSEGEKAEGREQFGAILDEHSDRLMIRELQHGRDPGGYRPADLERVR